MPTRSSSPPIERGVLGGGALSYPAFTFAAITPYANAKKQPRAILRACPGDPFDELENSIFMLHLGRTLSGLRCLRFLRKYAHCPLDWNSSHPGLLVNPLIFRKQ